MFHPVLTSCIAVILFNMVLSKDDCDTKPLDCDEDMTYRTIDGSCNNLETPYLGKQNRPYRRNLPNSYGDGVFSLTKMLSGAPLPSPRVVSNVIFPHSEIANKRYTLALMQMGQVVAHDLSFNGPSDNYDRCCTFDNQPGPESGIDDRCADIDIPNDDPDYNTSDWKCMQLNRTKKASSVGCPTEKLDAKITTVTPWLDLSINYGNNEKTLAKLRSYSRGKLLVNHKNGYNYPKNCDAELCPRLESPEEPCYLVGDPRVNQNPQLTSLHIVFYNEHNRIAEVLSILNPHWDDEKIFQEARSINIAQYQHIVFNEILPGYIGKTNMIKDKLLYPEADCCVADYDSCLDPSVAIEFATAAFRHFHSLIDGNLQLYDESRKQVGVTLLSDYEFRPVIQEMNSTYNIHTLLRGLSIQAHAESDQFFTHDIKYKFCKKNKKFGDDLVSIDIQRNRDHGVGRYLEARKWCGLNVPTCWDDIDFISEDNVEKLKTIYETPADIELYVGGALETDIVPGSMMGETFHCIITKQFYNTRKSDRFFYENCEDTKITSDKLKSIKKASLARILCDNSKMYNIQARVAKLVSGSNPVESCDSLPRVDLSLWKEDTTDFKLIIQALINRISQILNFMPV